MKLFTLAATTVLLATPALAADAIVYNEPAAPAVVDTFSWTGGYIGVNAGYAWGKSKVDSNWSYVDVAESGDQSLDHSGKGFLGGVQAGYNWQFDKIVLGVETDIQAAGIKAEQKDGINFEQFTTKIDWFGTTRARIGYTPADRFMVYATGGIAYGQIKSEIWNQVSGSDTRIGYTVGAGAEYAISKNITVKTEYLYTDLGKLKYNFAANDTRDWAYTGSAEVKLPFHTIRVGVNYKF